MVSHDSEVRVLLIIFHLDRASFFYLVFLGEGLSYITLSSLRDVLWCLGKCVVGRMIDD